MAGLIAASLSLHGVDGIRDSGTVIRERREGEGPYTVRTFTFYAEGSEVFTLNVFGPDSSDPAALQLLKE